LAFIWMLRKPLKVEGPECPDFKVAIIKIRRATPTRLLFKPQGEGSGGILGDTPNNLPPPPGVGGATDL